MTVGMERVESGDKVPIVKSTGPTLENRSVSTDSKRWDLHSPEDTVDIRETSGGRGNTYGLPENRDPEGQRHFVNKLGS